MSNAINWVEIPALDIYRAAAFYSAVYGKSLQVNEQTVRKLVILPHENGGVGAALNQSAGFEPGDKGPLVYLNAGQDLNPMLNRVEAAGGRIVTPKTDLGGNGFYAIIRDTEGNHVALMSAE
jgi:uncharacterized protein